MQRSVALFGVVIVVFSLSVVVALQPPPPPAKPTPEHKKLSYFVGKWNVQGEDKPSPFGKGGKTMSTDTCEWFNGGFSVVCRYDGKGPDGPMKGMGILGYSSDQKVYTYYGLWNSAMTMTSVPHGTVQGDTWTYLDEGMMGGQKHKSRVTIKELSPTSHSFKMEMQGADGKWATLSESTATKAK